MLLTERNFVIPGMIQLFKGCKDKQNELMIPAPIREIQKEIAGYYSIENLRATEIDVPPKKAVELCIKLADQAIEIALDSNIHVNPKTKEFILSAKGYLESNELSMAADKILDAIDGLRYVGVLIV